MRRDPLGSRGEPRRPVLQWQGPSGQEEYALSTTRPVTIGREAKNTIAFDSRLVSKAHALIEFRDGEYTIQDLESANGTRVNGEATSIRVLEPGDRIEIGDVELTFLDLDGGAGSGPSRAAAPAAGSSKAVRLAITGVVTLVVMLGLMFSLVRSVAPKEAAAPRAAETLAPAAPEVMARLKAAAEGSRVVKDTVEHATLAAVPALQALQEAGRLRLETERWRDAALLLAAAAARDPKDASLAASFAEAAAQLDRAASKALAAAELAQFGMRYDDALLHADAVLQYVDPSDPRYDRALKVAEAARAATRAKP